MSKSIMQSTQVMIAIQVSGDREAEIISLLVMLAQVLTALWRFGIRVYRIVSELIALISDAHQAASFTVKVMAIGLTALAWGVGVRL